MLDNTLIPLYQERVTSLTFNTEHTSEHLDTVDLDDDEDDEQSEEWLEMSRMGRGAGKHERTWIFSLSIIIKNNNITWYRCFLARLIKNNPKMWMQS